MIHQPPNKGPWVRSYIVKLEYYPYDKFKSPQTETPTSNRRGGVLWSELWSTQIWSLHLGGGCSDLNFGQLKSEVFILGGRGGTLIWTLVNSNLKSSLGRGGVLWSELWSTQIWIFIWEGRWVLWSEIPKRAALENLGKNLLFSQKSACASQIVSHMLRMWRLKNTKHEGESDGASILGRTISSDFHANLLSFYFQGTSVLSSDGVKTA